jgi:hypothetical protein
VRQFLRRKQVRVLPRPTGRVAQLAEQNRCRQFLGEKFAPQALRLTERRSIGMLDPESEQIRDVYAFFGLAVHTDIFGIELCHSLRWRGVLTRFRS